MMYTLNILNVIKMAVIDNSYRQKRFRKENIYYSLKSQKIKNYYELI